MRSRAIKPTGLTDFYIQLFLFITRLFIPCSIIVLRDELYVINFIDLLHNLYEIIIRC